MFRKASLKRIAMTLASIVVLTGTVALYPADLLFADTKDGVVINVTSGVNVRQEPTTGSNVQVTIPLGTALKVEETVAAKAGDRSGATAWYKVTVTYGGRTYSGYISNAYVQIKENTATPTPTKAPGATSTPTPTPSATPTPNPNATVTPTPVASATPTPNPNATQIPVITAIPSPKIADSNFEEQIKDFPESYKPNLRSLHEKHPSWVFVPEKVQANWLEVLNIECKSGKSLIPNTVEDAWKSKADGHYDPNSKTYKVVDSPNWVNAARPVVAYYLDPRNALQDGAVFQFLDLSYGQSAIPNNPDQYISRVLNGTFMANATGIYADSGIEYNKLFAIAGYESSINPIFLASKAIQEVGVTGSVASNGSQGYYNFYNIGAYSDATKSAYVGLKFAQFGNGVENSDFNKAYMIPWKTQGSSIIGGAKWMSDYYTSKGQNTVYYMRFNVSPSSANKIGYHQYMTATQSATEEAKKMSDAYTQTGLAGSKLRFVVPVYEGIPSTPCQLPTTDNVAAEFANRVYSVLYDRTPTADELTKISSALASGTEAVDYVADLVFASEFQTKNKTREDQVKMLFRLLLNRETDDEGVKYFIEKMDAGYSIKAIYGIIANSEECKNIINLYGFLPGTYENNDLVDLNMKLKPFVERLYTGFMGRKYDVGGLRNWISQLASKTMTGQEVAAAFFNSPEFQNMKLSNEDFVKRLYAVTLGREPDAEGLKFWTDEMNNKHYSRAYILQGFLNSPEFNNLCTSYGINVSSYTAPKKIELNYNKEKAEGFVTRLYQLALGREPEEGGFKHWNEQLKNGMNGYDVSYGFIFSQELQNKNLSDTDYVSLLYKVFLNREGEPNGISFWVGEMQKGSTRKQVFEGFVYSPEFEGLCVDAGIVPNANFG